MDDAPKHEIHRDITKERRRQILIENSIARQSYFSAVSNGVDTSQAETKRMNHQVRTDPGDNIAGKTGHLKNARSSFISARRKIKPRATAAGRVAFSAYLSHNLPVSLYNASATIPIDKVLVNNGNGYNPNSV